MADVTIKYKGSTIAEMSGNATKTLKTSGTYCEGDISVSYAPRSKSYEITLTKASGWVLLTTLDAEVLEHINDDGLVVSLRMISPYTYTSYAGNSFFAGNTPIGYSGSYPIYGQANRTTSSTVMASQPMYYKAGYTGSSDSLGGYGAFRVNGNKYYVKPYDGYVYAGTYRLTFTW